MTDLPRFPASVLLGGLQHLSWSGFTLGTELLGNAPEAETRTSIETMSQALTVCKQALSGVPLSPVVRGQLERLEEALNDHPNIAFSRPDRLAYEFQLSLATEFESKLFLLIPSTAVRLYMDPIGWFEEERPVLKKFPQAKENVIAAGQCYSLRQWDATVYHAVCVLDHGLVKLAKGIRATVPPRAGWHELITNIEKRIQILMAQNPRPKRTAKLLERYADAAAQMHYFRMAWRNETMHARKHYSEAEARIILNGAKYFMRALS